MWSIFRGAFIVQSAALLVISAALAQPRVKKTALCSSYLVAAVEAQRATQAGSAPLDRVIQNLMQFRERSGLPREYLGGADGVFGGDVLLSSREDYSPQREKASRQIYGIWQDRQIAKRRDAIQVFQALEFRGVEQIRAFLGEMAQLHRQFGKLDTADVDSQKTAFLKQRQELMHREQAFQKRQNFAQRWAPLATLITAPGAFYFGLQAQQFFAQGDRNMAVSGALSLGLGVAASFFMRAFALVESNYAWGSEQDESFTQEVLSGRMDWYYHSAGIEIDPWILRSFGAQNLNRENLLLMKNGLAELEVTTEKEQRELRLNAQAVNGVSLRVDRLLWTDPSPAQKPILSVVVRLADDLPYQSGGGRRVTDYFPGVDQLKTQGEN